MHLILVAGIPASGKTTFAKYLSENLQIPMVSKDEIKELLFDDVGFHSRAEKVALGTGSLDIMYYFAESLMKVNKPFILENNFEDVSKPKLIELLEKYKYKCITILFYGDLQIIYKRFLEREKSSSRHKGHIVNTEYPIKSDNFVLPAPIDYDTFKNNLYERGIISFSAGDVIKADTTDFSKVSYSEILKQVKDIIAKC